jgi:hypothetical protein
MYAAMHKISTQLLHRTKSRIIGWEQPVVIAVALSGRGPRGDAMFRNWMRLTNEVVMLGFETQRVIGLRWVKIGEAFARRARSRVRGTAHGHRKNHCFSGSRDDPGSRWLSWEGNTPLSNACAGEQTPLVEVLATETNTLTALIHVNDVRGHAAVLALFDEVIAAG